MERRRILIGFGISLASLVLVMSLFYLGAAYARESRDTGVPVEDRPSVPNLYLFVGIIFSVGILVGIVVFWYYYPETRPRKNGTKITQSSTPLDVLRYLSSEDEIIILNALLDFDGDAYQFELVQATGLTKMKVHRILARFDERGIINKSKIGKNNRIVISEWLDS